METRVTPGVATSVADRPEPTSEDLDLSQLQRDAHADDPTKRSEAMSKLARLRWNPPEGRIDNDLASYMLSDATLQVRCRSRREVCG